MLQGHMDRLERRKQRPQRPAWPTMRRALELHRDHAKMVAGLLVVIVFGAIAGLGPPLITQRIIDDTLPGPGDTGGDPWLLNALIVAMIGLVAVSALLGVAQSFLSNSIGQAVMYDLRKRLYSHLTRMSLRWFTANRTGEVLSRISNDVGAVQSVVSDTLGGLVGNLITAGTTLALMLFLDWRLALFSTAFMPIFIIPARRVGNIQRQLVTESQEQLAMLNSQMQETLSVSGALLVKTFGRQGDEIGRFDATAHEIRVLGVRRAMVGRWFQMSMGLFAALAPAVVYWYGGHRIIDDQASLGTVVASAALLARLFSPVTQLLNVNVTILSSLALFERVFDYLDLPVEIDDRADAIDLHDPRGEVRFDDVQFSYIEGKPALQGVSFEVPAGKFAAFVGHSGAGKTTAAYLVPRLYDVEHGSITIDGHDIRDVSLESLGQAIGMVNQEPFLFHDTIRMNLRYGAPEATDAEVERAARAANIHELIASLPWGYDTVVGERGYRLSGGEKQRVAIARALLKDPAILILDEATSSVDSKTERAIQDALETLTRGRTVLAIAHRLSTVLAADLILVLDHGRVVERGTHAELLAMGGTYAGLYRQQFAEGEVADGRVGDWESGRMGEGAAPVS
jgi:ATP-binding cassette subfamily B protein